MGCVPDLVRLGDVTLPGALLRGLGVPAVQTGLIERGFRAGRPVSALLDPVAPAGSEHALPGLGALSEGDALARLEAHLAQAGLDIIGHRDAGDILQGLREREIAAGLPPLTPQARERLAALLSLDVPLAALDASLAALGFGEDIRAGWQRIGARLRVEAPELFARARFTARLGRRFRYYDGLTFDMVSDALSPGQPLASGGRYDGLVGALGGPGIAETAIGAVIRPERVARVVSAAASPAPLAVPVAASAEARAGGSARLTLAIPSKGRLKEQCEEAFAALGLSVSRTDGERSYRARLSGAGIPEIDVLLLSSAEIAERLTRGTLQAGITGQDLLEEAADPAVSPARVLARLGFGEARVVVAVPAFWLDVDTLADLEGAGRRLREHQGRRLILATKYPALTRRHLSRAGVTEYRIVDSAGATEAAPASGSADLIVDITTTGATLKANQLRILSDGELLDSQAALAFSTAAVWSEPARDALKALAARTGLVSAAAITTAGQAISGIDKA
jgi:ATP phosphoribosyltransferase